MVSADALKPSTDSDLGNAPRGSIAWGLGALDEVLDLSDPEKNALAQGLAFEERVAVD